MPKGTKVHKQYEAMREEGMSKGKAAKIAQSQSGQALATGKKPKKRKPKQKHRLSKVFD